MFSRDSSALRFDAQSDACSVINASRLQLCMKKQLLRPDATVTATHISLVEFLDKNLEAVKSRASASERETLDKQQAEVKRLLAKEESNDLASSSFDEELPTGDDCFVERIAASRNSKKGETPSRKIGEARPSGKNQSSQDTTSAANIQNLLLQQKDISAQELDDERKTQAELANELMELTSILKDNTIAMNRAVVEQNQQLDVMQKHAEENVSELNDQKKKLSKQHKSQAYSIWTTVWILTVVLLSFAGTYVVMRLFPKPY